MAVFDIFKSKPKEPVVMVVDDDLMLMEMYEAFLCVFRSNRPLFRFNSATIPLNSAMSKT